MAHAPWYCGIHSLALRRFFRFLREVPGEALPTVVEVMVKVYRPGPEGGKANLIVRVWAGAAVPARRGVPRAGKPVGKPVKKRGTGRKARHGPEEPVGKPVKKPGTGRKAGRKTLRKAEPRLA